MAKQTLRQRIERAVRANDSKAAQRIVEFLRFRHGMNYREIYDVAHRCSGVSVAQWDALLG